MGLSSRGRLRSAMLGVAVALACRKAEPPPPAAAPVVVIDTTPVPQAPLEAVDAGITPDQMVEALVAAAEPADAGSAPQVVGDAGIEVSRPAPPPVAVKPEPAQVAVKPAAPPPGVDRNDCNACHAKLTADRKVHAPLKSGGCKACHQPKPGGAGACQSAEASAWQLVSAQPDLCQKCHSATAASGKLHAPIKSGGCTSCHDPHGSKNPSLMKIWPVQDACYKCHARVDDDKSVHTPVKAGNCTGCHDPHSSDYESLLINEKQQLCFECHKQEALKHGKVSHPPFAEARCLQCHEPHAAEDAPILKASGRKLCLGCHDAKAKSPVEVRVAFRVDLSKKKVHAPLKGDGACQACHVQKHGGSTSLLLQADSIANLCAKCHPKYDDLPYQHGAVKMGRCTGCHDPHSADLAGLLRAPRQKELCFRCHVDDLAGRRVVHKPIADKGCTACHDPHGADYPNDLTDGEGKDLCDKCHKPVDKVKFPHAALTRDGCNGCHDPHAADNAGLLVQGVNALCTSCHEAQKTGDHVSTPPHKVTGGSDPKHKERAFSCVSCHDPHGTDNPKGFYFGATRQGMCVYCHGDKARAARAAR